LLEAIGIEPPREVEGVHQRPFDGVSLLYSFTDRNARTRKTTQYFEMVRHNCL
jgi:arylsulfatase